MTSTSDKSAYAAHARLDVHNEVLSGIKSDVSEIKDGMKWVTRYFITVAVAFIAWMAIQLYRGPPPVVGPVAAAAEVHK